MKLITLNKDPNIKIDNKLTYFLNPDYVYIPIFKNKLKVKQNEYVCKGDVLFLNNFSVLAPISGIIYGISTCNINNHQEKCLVIKNDFREKRRVIKHKTKQKLTIDSLLSTLEEYNQKHLLSIFKNIKIIDNLVISIIDDEPYNHNCIMLMKENVKEVLDMIDELSILYNTLSSTIVVKECESNIIEECLNTIGTYPNIKISLVDDLYLLERKDFLLEHLKYDSSKTLYLNIKDILDLAALLINREVNLEKYLTISGEGVMGQVLRVKKYSNAYEVISKNIKVPTDAIYFINGVMSGYVGSIQDLIITDDVNCINIMKKRKNIADECFNCGKCSEICPVKINPIKCMWKQKSDKRCLNCGLCNYICPVYLDLKAYVRGDKK